jgi:hypothetical protein
VAVDLVFGRAPYIGLPIDLVFGETEPQAVPDPIVVTVAVQVAQPSFSMAVIYDNRVKRYAAKSIVGMHGVARTFRPEIDSGWGIAGKLRKSFDAGFAQATAIGLSARIGYSKSQPISRSPSVVWSLGMPLSRDLMVIYERALSQANERIVHWGLASHVGIEPTVVVETATKLRRDHVYAWERAAAVGYSLTSPFKASKRPLTHERIIPWEQGKSPRNGKYVRVVPPPAFLPYVGDGHLLFQCPPLQAPWVLIFGDHPCAPGLPPAAFQILPARFYMTTNTVFAQLLPSLAEVPIDSGATISQDVGSYAWTLSASGPASLYNQLAPLPGEPKIIRLTINGIQFVFQLDSPKRTHSFGETKVSITGRSVTASLGAGFARESTRLSTAPFTAQQLAALAIDGSGITLDWGIEDWLVPAGAWSHTGTPLAAVQAIAEAAGGYVQSHRSLAQLQVRHPYPLLPGGIPGGPWNWNSAFPADVQLAPDAIISSSLEVRPAAAINAVYVSGAEQGVLALVKRAGSAGDKLAQMVVDQLITANETATQRGTAIVGAAGDKVMHQLELPVLTGAGQPGILSTDQLIEVTDLVPWRGRVRAVSVTHDWPSLRQSVLLEAA